MKQEKFLLPLAFSSIQIIDWMIPIHIWEGDLNLFLLSSPIRMPISSRNTSTDILRNNFNVDTHDQSS